MPALMTPAAFVAKWRRTKLSERAASQEHFIDLCRLLGQPTPAEHDATGAEYTFEKGIPGNANLPIGRGGGGGFADVWWDGKFGWEYKRKDKYKTLEEAYAQLQRYREALNNPPLLIVSDIARIEIHTNFNNTANETHTITLDDILDGPGVDKLRRVFTRPESFKPEKTTEQVTLHVAKEIGKIAQRLQKAGKDPHAVAHFLMKCMFCLFAEKVPGLLPDRLFKNLLNRNYLAPDRFTKLAGDLFRIMATGGDFGTDAIPYFNGGLFDEAPPIELDSDELGILNLAANQDWAHIEPSILGTLFERSLDPDKRAQIGAHYTSKDDILLVINPVIMDPLRKEWSKLKQTIEAQLLGTPLGTPISRLAVDAANGTRSVSEGRPDAAPAEQRPNAKAASSASTPKSKIENIENQKSKIPQLPLTTIHEKIAHFLAQLSSLKILDPACGSGNFLYVAIQQLLTLEKEIITFAAQPPISLDLQPRIRPTQLLGIEINPYAAELAQVSIWIGFLQWLHLNGFPVATDTPILSKIQTIENRDAILDFTNNPSRDRKGATNVSPSPARLATPAQWPDAHFIIGNPPFLGSKLFRANGLPNDYVAALYKAYDLPKTSDLCCYWFELARQKIERAINPPPPRGGDKPLANSTAARSARQPSGTPDGNPVLDAPSQINLSPFPNLSLPRAGLLATQAIRGGDNRTVIERIKKAADIFMAWSDKEWILEGAAVNVSIVAFASSITASPVLDGVSVSEIYTDLSSGTDTTGKSRLPENQNIGFMADTKGGPFEMDWTDARTLLAAPNPNGRPGIDVLRPWVNGLDIIRRNRAMWIVDFGCDMKEAEAAGYEAAFERVRTLVYPERKSNRRESYAERWWIHVEARPAMRAAVPTSRFLATPNLTKHRAFSWIDGRILADHQLIVFARSDDYFFGVLHSSIHELWSLETGTQLEDRPRYTATTTFETFPLPWPPGKENTKHPAYKRIAAAAKELNDLRERWLNPPELLAPLAQILDAQDKFLDVPEEARPLIRHSALMAEAAKSPNLKKRTLTNLYNERPTWLKLAHEKLDRAVLAAYAAVDPEGHWHEDWAALYTETGAGQPLPKDHPQAAQRAEVDQKILTNLLRLNQKRANSPQSAGSVPREPERANSS